MDKVRIQSVTLLVILVAAVIKWWFQSGWSDGCGLVKVVILWKCLVLLCRSSGGGGGEVLSCGYPVVVLWCPKPQIISRQDCLVPPPAQGRM